MGTKRRGEKKEMEYPDAPSGYVTLYNYKEPFMAFTKGYGYEGVLLFDGKDDKVQCHFCGDWFVQLGHHLNKEHSMTASQYKEQVGLTQSTALIGEAFRAKLIASGTSRFSNLRAGVKKSKKERQKIRETMQKNVRQIQNLRGTCPEQLLYRLQNLAKELGRCPTTRECGFLPTLEKVYGSYANACQLVGLTPLKSGQTITNVYKLESKNAKYSFAEISKVVYEYWKEHGTKIKAPNFPDRTMYARYLRHRDVINKMAFQNNGVFQKLPVKIHYSKEELLDIIRRFKVNEGRDPSISDCKRGLLPHASRYYYHFGSFREALKLA